MPTKTLSSFTRALLEGDFANLVGRLILIPTINEGKILQREQGQLDFK